MAALSIVLYVIAKFFVYRLVGIAINRRLNLDIDPVVFAIVRLIIGFIIGSGCFVIAGQFNYSTSFILYGIFPIVRLLEWFIAITYFYDREMNFVGRTFKYSAICTPISFSADVLGIIFGSISGATFC